MLQTNHSDFIGSDLGGAGDGLASPVAASDHHLLGQEDLLSGDLDAQVAAGDHDAVAGLHDLVESARGGQKKKRENVLVSMHLSGSHQTWPAVAGVEREI